MSNLRAAILAFLTSIALTLLLAACGDDDDRVILTPVTAEYFPATISSDVAVGSNRFVMGLLTQEQVPVPDADLRLRFFFPADSDSPALKSEMDAVAVTIQKSYTHTHSDGTVESHEAGEVGVYVANVAFDTAGSWVVEVSGTLKDGEAIETQTNLFSVRDESLSPGIGEPAPQSVQAILSDVTDIREIDTSVEPIPEMHDKTIAEAVTSGTPSVIVFATPAFCVSQICGPTKDFVDDLYDVYASEANFVHVEPYDLVKARAGTALEVLPLIVDDWGLQNEPWVFIVGADGNIAAKFEGTVSYEELEAALQTTLPS